MVTNGHPSSIELLAAVREPTQSASTLEHLNECVACRIRLSRIQRDTGSPVKADTNSIQRIIEASTPLPENVADIVADDRQGAPQPNEIWRVGRDEALLVWVRRVFDDAVADVIPVVLDIELADQETVLIDANATPLGTDAGAMVALRTHVHSGAFLNRVSTLDIHKEVSEVMTAVREGRRPSRVPVGPPILDDDDQRLEYRQALRDVLADLSPSAWQDHLDELTPTIETVETSGAESAVSIAGIAEIKTELQERLPGLSCFEVRPSRIPVVASAEAIAVLKVTYLDTAVLVATLSGANLAEFPDIVNIASTCLQLTRLESDVGAVAIAMPENDWQSVLLTTTHMRSAYQVPDGDHAGPTSTVRGLRLVDTVFKYLDEFAMTAWEHIEPSASGAAVTNLDEIAARHADTSIKRIAEAGKRAHQEAKRATWTNLSDDLAGRAARFVIAVANDEPLTDALKEFIAEGDDA
jgi:hypothetical protein